MKYKVLATNEDATDYSCEFSKVVEFENGKKFKITHDTGNCYSKTSIFVMLPTFEWAMVANGFDIGANDIHYHIDSRLKRDMMKNIYDKAIDYINKVFLS